MIQKGDLKRISFPRLLQWVIQNQKSGTIRVVREQEAKVLVCKDGELLGAFSDNAKDKLWMIFYRYGMLDEHQLVELQKRQQQNGKQLEELVLELDLLTAGEISSAKVQQAKEITLTLFDWSDGEFLFYPDKFPEYKPLEARPLLRDLHLLGQKRLQQWHVFQNQLKNDDRLQLQVKESLDKTMFRPLSPFEQQLIALLRNDLTVRELIEISPLYQFDTLAFVHDLVSNKALKIITPGGEKLIALVEKAEQLKQEGKHWEAFTIIKELLNKDPLNQEYQLLLKEYTKNLADDLKIKLGNMNSVPRIIKALDPELWKNLGFDAVDGYILSRIDGKLTLRELFSIIQMDSKRILTTLYRLMGSGIIEIKQPMMDPQAVNEQIKQLNNLYRTYGQQTYFQIIGLDAQASELDIKRAYLELVKRYHPDTVPVEGNSHLQQSYANVFAKIQEAYVVLTDSVKRAAYEKSIGIKHESAFSAEEERSRDKARTQFRIGLQSFKARDYARAIEYIQSAIDLNPNEAVYYAKLAEVCMKNPRWYNSGKNACGKAIELDPDNPNYYCLRGLLLKMEGNFVEAEVQLRNALQIDPSNSLARREMLALGLKLKDLPKRQVFSDAIGTELMQRKQKKIT